MATPKLIQKPGNVYHTQRIRPNQNENGVRSKACYGNTTARTISTHGVMCLWKSERRVRTERRDDGEHADDLLRAGSKIQVGQDRIQPQRNDVQGAPESTPMSECRQTHCIAHDGGRTAHRKGTAPEAQAITYAWRMVQILGKSQTRCSSKAD